MKNAMEKWWSERKKAKENGNELNPLSVDDFDIKDYPLHQACFHEDLEVLNFLLSDDYLNHVLQQQIGSIETDVHSDNRSTCTTDSVIGYNVVMAPGMSRDEQRQAIINCFDNWHNTPLHISVMRNNQTMVERLLQCGVKVKAKNLQAWTALDEAISIGDRDLLKTVYKAHRDQVLGNMKDRTPQLLQKIEGIGDFFLAIDWKIHSWLPFLSRVCPTDQYKVYKKGASVRVDTTLVEFSDLSWKRGDISFIFKMSANGDARFLALDNEKKKYQWISSFNLNKESNSQTKHKKDDENIEMDLDMFLSSYISNVSMPTKHITFKRLLGGVWGFRQPRVDKIHDNVYEARVFQMQHCNLYMRKRKEHLSDEDIQDRKKKIAAMKRSAISEKAFAEAVNEDVENNGRPVHRPSIPAPPYAQVSHANYFNVEVGKSMRAPHLGRPIKLKEQEKTFPATLWMVDDFPLSIEILLNVLQIIAPSNKHFSKVENVMKSKLPEGFPARMEVPIFPTLSATVSFTEFHQESVDAEKFVVPADYVEDPNAFPGLSGN